MLKVCNCLTIRISRACKILSLRENRLRWMLLLIWSICLVSLLKKRNQRRYCRVNLCRLKTVIQVLILSFLISNLSKIRNNNQRRIQLSKLTKTMSVLITIKTLSSKYNLWIWAKDLLILEHKETSQEIFIWKLCRMFSRFKNTIYNSKRFWRWQINLRNSKSSRKWKKKRSKSQQSLRR